MPTEEANTETDRKLSWDGIGAFLGAVSGLSFFLSLVFDMGYFSTVGLRFADLPTSISDHVRSALLWVPQAVGALFGYAALTLMQWMFADVVRRERSENGRKSTTSWPVSRWVYRGLFAVALVVLWLDLLSGGALGKYGAVAAPIVVLYIALDIAPRVPFLKRLSPATIVSVFASAAITLFVYYAGVGQAIEERQQPSKVTLTMDGPKELHLTLYRYLDRGVLAGDEQGQLVFYRWDDIKRLSASFSTPERTNWLCKAVDIACARLANQPATPNAGQHQ